MKVSAITQRYARALFDVSQGAGQARRVLEDLQRVDRTITADADLAQVLTHPRLGADRKVDLLGRIFGDGLHEISWRAIGTLGRRNRLDSIGTIVLSLEKLILANEGVVRGSVVSARDLDDQMRDQVNQRLGQLTGKRVELQYSVDSALIGGLQIQVGDRLIDGSVRYHLELMRERLKALRLS